MTGDTYIWSHDSILSHLTLCIVCSVVLQYKCLSFHVCVCVFLCTFDSYIRRMKYAYLKMFIVAILFVIDWWYMLSAFMYYSCILTCILL